MVSDFCSLQFVLRSYFKLFNIDFLVAGSILFFSSSARVESCHLPLSCGGNDTSVHVSRYSSVERCHSRQACPHFPPCHQSESRRPFSITHTHTHSANRLLVLSVHLVQPVLAPVHCGGQKHREREISHSSCLSIHSPVKGQKNTCIAMISPVAIFLIFVCQMYIFSLF